MMLGLEEYLDDNPLKTEIDWAESFIASTSVDVVDMLLHGVVDAISETGTTIKGIQGICRHYADEQPGLLANWEKALAIRREEASK